jgi:hypothetical protein
MTAWHMFRLTLFHSLSAKHPGFREENEWRIVYLSDLDTQKLLTGQRSYLIRGNTVEPRLKFPIEPLKIEPPQEWTFNSILDRIVLGPTHSSSAFTMSSVRQMLECIGRPEFASKVWASRISIQADWLIREATPAYLPTAAVRGRDPRRPQYVDSANSGHVWTYMDPARLQRVWQRLVPRSQLLTYIRLPDAA